MTMASVTGPVSVGWRRSMTDMSGACLRAVRLDMRPLGRVAPRDPTQSTMSHAAVLDDKDLRLHDRPGFSDAGRRRSCDRQLLLKRSRRGAFVVTAPTRQERMPMSETLGLLRHGPISPAE